MLDENNIYKGKVTIGDILGENAAGIITSEVEALFCRKGRRKIYGEEFPIFSIRAYEILGDINTIRDVLCMGVEDLISELKKFKVPGELCLFKHHFATRLGELVLTPESCDNKRHNPCCGHPELNNIALYLILAYKVLGQDVSAIDDYVYGVLEADLTAQTEEEAIGMFQSIQEIYGGFGQQHCQNAAQALEERFVKKSD